MIYVSDTTRIGFRHTVFTHPKRKRNALTACYIQTKSGDGDWETWKEGDAYCSLGDNFHKATGRKIALAEALSTVEPKSLRQDFWEAYFRKVKM